MNGWFDGMRVIHAAHMPRCNAWIDKRFDGYAVLNFCAAGRLHWEMDGHVPRTLEGPVAWTTWPGPRWRFGLPPHGGTWEHYTIGFAGPRVTAFLRRGLGISGKQRAS